MPFKLEHLQWYDWEEINQEASCDVVLNDLGPLSYWFLEVASSLWCVFLEKVEAHVYEENTLKEPREHIVVVSELLVWHSISRGGIK